MPDLFELKLTCSRIRTVFSKKKSAQFLSFTKLMLDESLGGIKWPFFIGASLDGSGKNKKIPIFPTGLEVQIEDMF